MSARVLILASALATLAAPVAGAAYAAPNVARSVADAAEVARLRAAFDLRGPGAVRRELAAPVTPAGLADGSGTWRELTPPARQGAAAVFDPERDRILMFGGANQGLHDETWSFDPRSARWTRLAPGGRIPTPRSNAALVYDDTSDRLWMFGGNGSTGPLTGLWSFDLAGEGTWALLQPLGILPDGRGAGALVRDPGRDRLLLFGGKISSSVGSGATGDVWSVSLTADTLRWIRLTPAGQAPAARWGAIVVFDAPRDRMVVIGGRDRDSVFTDAWELRFTPSLAWAPLSVYGTTPPVRDGALGVLDEAGGRIVTIGGTGAGGGGTNPEVWSFHLEGLATWSREFVTGPAPTDLGNACAAWDPIRQRVVTHGGGLPFGQFPNYTSHQTWAFDPAGPPVWQRVAPAEQEPAPRYGQASAISPGSDAFWIFGGQTVDPDGYEFANDLWRAELGDPEHWTALHPTGAAPPGRRNGVAAFDPIGRRLVVFGGYNHDMPDPADQFLGDTWSVTVDSPWVWTPIAGAGPTPRTGHTAVYAPLRRSLLVFGGINTDSTFGDVWELPFAAGGTWRRLVPEGAGPGARYFARAVYDAHHDRMIVFGGTIDAHSQDDVWALSLADPVRWTRLEPGGSAPGGRTDHGAAYDDARGRMLVWGGYDEDSDLSSSSSGVWALALDGYPTWQYVQQSGTEPFPADGPTMLYDAARDRVVTFGGSEFIGAYLADFRVLEFAPGGMPRPAWIAGARAGSDGAHVLWQTTYVPGTAVGIEKKIDVPGESGLPGPREQRTDWLAQGNATVGDDGSVAWEDAGTRAGGTYGYRLVRNGVPAGETALMFPGTPHFALERVLPQPTTGSISIAFYSSGTGPVLLALYDVRGRRVDERDYGALPEGSASRTYDLPSDLRAGVYFLQARQGSSVATHKIVFAR